MISKTLLPVLVLLLAACGGERVPPPGGTTDDPDAATAVARMEARQAEVAHLPPGERMNAERALGPELARTVEQTRGSKYENKAVYWLAQWSLIYDRASGPESVDRLLDRLDGLPSPAYHQAGKALRVQVRLRQGRLSEAKTLAERVDATVPQLATMRLVRFHGLVGHAVPALAGVPAAGSGDPAAEPEPLLLIAFVGVPDAGVDAWLATYLARLKPGRIRLIAVVGDGSLLDAGAAAARWGANGASVDVRWIASQGDVSWLDAWSVPVPPVAVLVGPGPQRLVLAADPAPEDLDRILR